MPAIDVLNKVNPHQELDQTVTNFAAVSSVDAVGVADFTDPNSAGIDNRTMFGEGSIGKVRFAGLAYILDQRGDINLGQPAKGFFASEKMREFLEEKYPGQGQVLQTEIAKFFSGNNEEATLAELTNHSAGVGDLTRDHMRLFAKDGVGKDYSIPDLLIPGDHSEIPRDEHGKPRRQDKPGVADENLPLAERGKHEYSNLGYMLLGLAMEQAYAQRYTQNKPEKSYKDLTKEFLLEPLGLTETKFFEDLRPTDKVARAKWFESRDGKEELVDAAQFRGANAAGGMFVSVEDSKKFFAEFFRGFPGTKEGETNRFFSPQTIEKMMKQVVPAGKRGNGNDVFQMPGFNCEKDPSGNIVGYDKGGGTFGYKSQMKFDPKTGEVNVEMRAQENLSQQSDGMIKDPELAEIADRRRFEVAVSEVARSCVADAIKAASDQVINANISKTSKDNSNGGQSR
jgi:CubicO group peptidase (beta-lactamase class C family)